tara:strand:- start:462 stop:1901 length:1440 start_codon:yes stop_codon:yes gene_type:complete
MVKDFSDIEENSFYEILVIGAGAAGITLSLELENSKYKVALIEAGDLKNNIENQKLMEMETDGPLKHPPLETVRARQFGGTTNLWGAGLVKFDEIDFMDRPNINIDGWPISFAEIEPYYERAKEYLKVSKESFSNNSMLSSINDKLLNNDVVEQKNILRHKSGSNFRKMYLDRFQKSDNITLFLNSTLSDISINNKNIKYVEISNQYQLKKRIKCKTVVLCCGGVENTRLLLNFNKKNKYNIGNVQNALGNYYSTHINLINGTLLTSDRINNNYADLNNYVSERKYLTLKNQFIYENNLLNVKIHFEKLNNINLLPKFFNEVSTLISSKAKKLNKYYLNSQFEQTPCKTSSIKLIEEKDIFGLYKAKIYFDINSSDIDVFNLTYKNLAIIFGALNIGRFHYENVKNVIYRDVIGGSHHIGTTRMITKNYGGSVDKNLNVTGTNNLFCVSSSCFPTPGHANPTFTIIALSIKLADYIKNE